MKYWTTVIMNFNRIQRFQKIEKILLLQKKNLGYKINELNNLIEKKKTLFISSKIIYPNTIINLIKSTIRQHPKCKIFRHF